MAYAKITFEHPEIGTVRKAPVGFSWTAFIFGPIVALIRKDWLGALIMVLLVGFTSGISLIVAPFFYNKFYIKRLLKKGYKVASIEGSDIIAMRKRLEINLPQK